MKHLNSAETTKQNGMKGGQMRNPGKLTENPLEKGKDNHCSSCGLEDVF